MPSGLLEWFAKRFALEAVKRRLFSDDSDEEYEIESELYDAFVAEYDGFELTEPTGNDESVTVSEDLHGEIVSLTVEREGDATVTGLFVELDDAVLDHLPPEEERVESTVNFFLEKDKLSVAFDEQSRVGPLLTIYVPSTRKGDIKSGIEAVRVILSRLVHSDLYLYHAAYELIEAGYDVDRYLDDDPAIEGLREELEDDEFEKLMRYLTGSFAGHDPELDVEELNGG